MDELKQVNVSFKKIFSFPKQKRANRLINSIKGFGARYSKEGEVKLSQKLNELIWSNGRENVPRSLPLLVRLEKNKASVFLQDELESVKKAIAAAEKKKAEKKAKKEEKKKEEKKSAEEKPAKEEKVAQEEEQKKLEDKKAQEKAFEKAAMKKGTQ